MMAKDICKNVVGSYIKILAIVQITQIVLYRGSISWFMGTIVFCLARTVLYIFNLPNMCLIRSCFFLFKMSYRLVRARFTVSVIHYRILLIERSGQKSATSEFIWANELRRG